MIILSTITALLVYKIYVDYQKIEYLKAEKRLLIAIIKDRVESDNNRLSAIIDGYEPLEEK